MFYYSSNSKTAHQSVTTVITTKVLNLLLLCLNYAILNVIQFHIINCCLDTMYYYKVINVRPTDGLTEYDINQYNVNTIPITVPA